LLSIAPKQDIGIVPEIHSRHFQRPTHFLFGQLLAVQIDEPPVDRKASVDVQPRSYFDDQELGIQLSRQILDENEFSFVMDREGFWQFHFRSHCENPSLVIAFRAEDESGALIGRSGRLDFKSLRRGGHSLRSYE
jgi:hypothetical protein